MEDIDSGMRGGNLPCEEQQLGLPAAKTSEALHQGESDLGAFAKPRVDASGTWGSVAENSCGHMQAPQPVSAGVDIAKGTSSPSEAIEGDKDSSRDIVGARNHFEGVDAIESSIQAADSKDASSDDSAREAFNEQEAASAADAATSAEPEQYLAVGSNNQEMGSSSSLYTTASEASQPPKIAEGGTEDAASAYSVTLYATASETTEVQALDGEDGRSQEANSPSLPQNPAAELPAESHAATNDEACEDASHPEVLEALPSTASADIAHPDKIGFSFLEDSHEAGRDLARVTSKFENNDDDGGQFCAFEDMDPAAATEPNRTANDTIGILEGFDRQPAAASESNHESAYAGVDGGVLHAAGAFEPNNISATPEDTGDGGFGAFENAHAAYASESNNNAMHDDDDGGDGGFCGSLEDSQDADASASIYKSTADDDDDDRCFGAFENSQDGDASAPVSDSAADENECDKGVGAFEDSQAAIASESSNDAEDDDGDGDGGFDAFEDSQEACASESNNHTADNTGDLSALEESQEACASESDNHAADNTGDLSALEESQAACASLSDNGAEDDGGFGAFEDSQAACASESNKGAEGDEDFGSFEDLQAAYAAESNNVAEDDGGLVSCEDSQAACASESNNGAEDEGGFGTLENSQAACASESNKGAEGDEDFGSFEDSQAACASESNKGAEDDGGLVSCEDLQAACASESNNGAEDDGGFRAFEESQAACASLSNNGAEDEGGFGTFENSQAACASESNKGAEGDEDFGSFEDSQAACASESNNGAEDDGGLVSCEDSQAACASESNNGAEDDGDFGAFEDSQAACASVSKTDTKDDGGFGAFEESQAACASESNNQAEDDGDFGAFDDSQGACASLSNNGAEGDGDFGAFENSQAACASESNNGTEDNGGFGALDGSHQESSVSSVPSKFNEASDNNNDGFGGFEDGGFGDFEDAPIDAEYAPGTGAVSDGDNDGYGDFADCAASAPGTQGSGTASVTAGAVMALGTEGGNLAAALQSKLLPISMMARVLSLTSKQSDPPETLAAWCNGTHGGVELVGATGELKGLHCSSGDARSKWPQDALGAEFFARIVPGWQPDRMDLPPGTHVPPATEGVHSSSAAAELAQPIGTAQGSPFTPAARFSEAAACSDDPFSASGAVMSLTDYLTPSREEKSRLPQDGSLPSPGGPAADGSSYDTFGVFMALQAAKNTPMHGANDGKGVTGNDSEEISDARVAGRVLFSAGEVEAGPGGLPVSIAVPRPQDYTDDDASSGWATTSLHGTSGAPSPVGGPSRLGMAPGVFLEAAAVRGTMVQRSFPAQFENAKAALEAIPDLSFMSAIGD